MSRAFFFVSFEEAVSKKVKEALICRGVLWGPLREICAVNGTAILSRHTCRESFDAWYVYVSCHLDSRYKEAMARWRCF